MQNSHYTIPIHLCLLQVTIFSRIFFWYSIKWHSLNNLNVQWSTGSFSVGYLEGSVVFSHQKNWPPRYITEILLMKVACNTITLTHNSNPRLQSRKCVYLRTDVSVSRHFQNPTKCVGLGQSRHHHNLFDI